MASRHVVETDDDYLGTCTVGEYQVESTSGDVGRAIDAEPGDEVVVIEGNDGVIVLPDFYPVEESAILGRYVSRETHKVLRFRLGKPVLKYLGVEAGDRIRFYDRETGVRVTAVEEGAD